MNPRISIIILNWNGWGDTIECLESLYKINYNNYTVLLVDNGSENESIKKIVEYCDGKIEIKSSNFSKGNKPIMVAEYSENFINETENISNNFIKIPSNQRLIFIRNSKNSGFAEGNNIGIRYALEFQDPDYFLLLNNDTIVDKNFLSEMVSVAKADETIGFVGPKIYYYDFQGRKDVISVAGIELFMGKGAYHRIGETEIDKGQYDEMRSVDYLEGSCLLIKRQVLDEIGLLNGDYFAYWEETDFCMRGRKACYKSVYAPKARIWHKVSSSSIGLTKLYYMTRNRLWFMRDNAPARDLAQFFVYFFAYQFWLYIGVYLRHWDLPRLKIFLNGVWDGIMPRHG